MVNNSGLGDMLQASLDNELSSQIVTAGYPDVVPAKFPTLYTSIFYKCYNSIINYHKL